MTNNVVEYKLLRYNDPDEKFIQVGQITSDLTLLIAKALVASEESPTIIMYHDTKTNSWRRWHILYQGRELRI